MTGCTTVAVAEQDDVGSGLADCGLVPDESGSLLLDPAVGSRRNENSTGADVEEFLLPELERSWINRARDSLGSGSASLGHRSQPLTCQTVILRLVRNSLQSR
jgi:hypothetical protein